MFSEERAQTKEVYKNIRNKHSRKVHRQVDRLRTTAEVAELYVKGKTLQEIGELYGVSTQQAALWLKEVRESWLNSQVRNYAEAQAVQLAKIDRVEQELWEAWEKSKVGVKKTQKGRISRTGKMGGDEDSENEEIIHQPGDPKYIEGIQRCIAQRVKILGLDAPIKIAGTIEVTEDSMFNRENMAVEDKMKLYSKFLSSLQQTVVGEEDGRIRQDDDGAREGQNLLPHPEYEHPTTDLGL